LAREEADALPKNAATEMPPIITALLPAVSVSATVNARFRFIVSRLVLVTRRLEEWPLPRLTSNQLR
jgi:hypothetical protein